MPPPLPQTADEADVRGPAQADADAGGGDVGPVLLRDRRLGRRGRQATPAPLHPRPAQGQEAQPGVL